MVNRLKYESTLRSFLVHSDARAADNPSAAFASRDPIGVPDIVARCPHYYGDFFDHFFAWSISA